MCVFVSPDCPGVTPEGLRHLGNLRSLKHLQLQRMNVIVLNGHCDQEPWEWTRNLSSLSMLYISGELQWHTHLHCINRTNDNQ